MTTFITTNMNEKVRMREREQGIIILNLMNILLFINFN